MQLKYSTLHLNFSINSWTTLNLFDSKSVQCGGTALALHSSMCYISSLPGWLTLSTTWFWNAIRWKQRYTIYDNFFNQSLITWKCDWFTVSGFNNVSQFFSAYWKTRSDHTTFRFTNYDQCSFIYGTVYGWNPEWFVVYGQLRIKLTGCNCLSRLHPGRMPNENISGKINFGNTRAFSWNWHFMLCFDLHNQICTSCCAGTVILFPIFVNVLFDRLIYFFRCLSRFFLF